MLTEKGALGEVMCAEDAVFPLPTLTHMHTRRAAHVPTPHAPAQFYSTPVWIAMAAMSPHRVAWMACVVRGTLARASAAVGS